MKLRQYLAVVLVFLFLAAGASTAYAVDYENSYLEHLYGYRHIISNEDLIALEDLFGYRHIISNEALSAYGERVIVAADVPLQAVRVFTTQEDKEAVTISLQRYGINMNLVHVETISLNSSTAKVTANVNVRSGPGTAYKRLGKLKRAQSVPVLKVENKWAQNMWANAAIAYVHSDYISFNNETVVIGDDMGSMTTAKATANVNIRSGPGTEYEKLGQLKKGAQVIVKSVSGDWAQIEVSDGEPAYVSAKYIKRTDNSYSVSSRFTKDERAWYEVNIREALDLAGFSGEYTLTLNSDHSRYIVSVQNSLQESVFNRLENYGVDMNRVRVE